MRHKWVRRNGEMPSSWDMTYIRQTYLITETDTTPLSPSSMPLTASWTALSWRFKTISVTGSWIWLEIFSPLPPGCAVKRPKENLAGSKNTKSTASTPLLETTEKRGDILIRDLWKNGTNSVHDMRIMNTDAKSHSAKTLEKCLQEAERGKRRCTWRYAYNNADTSIPLLPQLMGFWVWRLQLP